MASWDASRWIDTGAKWLKKQELIHLTTIWNEVPLMIIPKSLCNSVLLLGCGSCLVAFNFIVPVQPIFRRYV